MDRSNFAAELCQHRNKTRAGPRGLMSESHSIPRPIATPTPIPTDPTDPTDRQPLPRGDAWWNAPFRIPT